MSSSLPPPPPLAVLRGHDDSVVSLTFLDKGLLFSGAANGKLRLWNLRTMRSVISMQAHYASILSINVHPDRKSITQSRDGTIKVWDTEVLGNSSQPVRTLRTGFDHFCNASLWCTTECSLLASPGMEQSEIILWDMRASQASAMRFTPDASAGMVTSLRLFESSVWSTSTTGAPSIGLLAGYEDGTLFGLDLRMGSKPTFSQKLHSEPIFALDAHISSKGTQVVTGGGDSLLQKSAIVACVPGEDAGSNQVKVATSERIDLPHAGTGCVKYRSDGRILVSTHWDGTVRVFDQKRLKPLAVLRHHRDSAYAVDFAPSTGIINTNGSGDAVDSALALPSAETAEPAEIQQEHDRAQEHWRATHSQRSQVPSEPVASDPGRGLPEGVFATGSKDHTIAIWDLFADSYSL